MPEVSQPFMVSPADYRIELVETESVVKDGKVIRQFLPTVHAKTTDAALQFMSSNDRLRFLMANMIKSDWSIGDV